MSVSEALLAEYRTLTQEAGIVDVSDRTKIELRGDDRASFLHNFCTNDIKRLQPGQGCEAFICNVKGHVLGHVQVFCDESSLWLDTVPGQAEKLLAHLDRYLIREKVELLDRTSGYEEFVIVGPKADEAIERQGKSAVARQIDLGSVPAYSILFDRAASESTQALNLPTCSREALEILRIEAGFPKFGIDITDDNLPQEVARDPQAISFTKGCYLGQETVARIDALGHVNRTLCGLAFAGETVPLVGMELKQGEKVVGAVTSACWSPRLKRPLALGYVRRGTNALGTALESECGNVEIIRLPL
jgi:folate-binding protein YgfZ